MKFGEIWMNEILINTGLLWSHQNPKGEVRMMISLLVFSVPLYARRPSQTRDSKQICQAERSLVNADITVNKNMVPFDARSPFLTYGIRIGTPAITTRGADEKLMTEIVEMIDCVLSNPGNEKIIGFVREKVNSIMMSYPMFAW